MKQQTPLEIEGINESIYAGFILRIGASILDFLILLPYTFLIIYLNGLSKDFYYLTIVIGLGFHLWFNIYLVKRYGGTPGKLISGIKIIKIDGEELTYKEAVLRQIVELFLLVFISIATIYSLPMVDEEHYQSLNWLKKQEYLYSLIPILFKIHVWVSNIWVYSELIVLLFNKRKRALHDFIAGTVIVKKKYLERIREAMANTVN